MLIKQNAGIRPIYSIKERFIGLFFLLCVCFAYHSHTSSLNADEVVCHSIFKPLEASIDKKFRAQQYNKQPIEYYLYIADFAQSFIQIPTSNVSEESSTISSVYLAGRAAIYTKDNREAGTCSASFLCMQNEEGIYTDISNFLSANNGLIVSWFTPTTLINLELDSIIYSMVTECIVMASTKVGVNPFYGQTFDLVVSSDDEKIYFEFTRTGTIF